MQKPTPKSLNPNQIIFYCQQNFINIVPNLYPRSHLPNPSASIQNSSPINANANVNKNTNPNANTSASMHGNRMGHGTINGNLNGHGHHASQEKQKQYIKIIIKQLSILLQLTIQNCVLTSDQKIKSLSYKLLGLFRDYLSRDLDDFQNFIHHHTRTKLPFYQIQCKDFLSRQLAIKIPPQVSIYQDPLLFYNYSKLAQQELFCNLPIYKTRQQRIQILKNHIPFLDPSFIPIIEERFQTKSKFTQLQDRLLLILLTLHSKKDLGEVKGIYFPGRNQSQIRNRAKNLCAKELNNSIKSLKENQYFLLNQREIQILKKAYVRFGPRWPVIAKYYQIRSGDMLQAQFQGCPKLAKLRRSYQIQGGPSLKNILQQALKNGKQATHPNNQLLQLQLSPQNQKQKSPFLDQLNMSNNTNNNRVTGEGKDKGKQKRQAKQAKQRREKQKKNYGNQNQSNVNGNGNESSNYHNFSMDIEEPLSYGVQEKMEEEGRDDYKGKGRDGEGQEQIFKIINHLTFLYQQI